MTTKAHFICNIIFVLVIVAFLCIENSDLWSSNDFLCFVHNLCIQQIAQCKSNSCLLVSVLNVSNVSLTYRSTISWNWFLYSTRICLYLSLILYPLWYLEITIDNHVYSFSVRRISLSSRILRLNHFLLIFYPSKIIYFYWYQTI